MLDVGYSLKKHRETASLSQSELARLTQIKQQNISRWENNTHFPNILDCVRLATFYNISIDYLLGIEDDFGVKTYGENLNNLAINELCEAEKTIVEIYRKLPEQRQQMLCQTAKDYYRVCFGDDKLSKFKVGS